jgi:hypothetical protein
LIDADVRRPTGGQQAGGNQGCEPGRQALGSDSRPPNPAAPAAGRQALLAFDLSITDGTDLQPLPLKQHKATLVRLRERPLSNNDLLCVCKSVEKRLSISNVASAAGRVRRQVAREGGLAFRDSQRRGALSGVDRRGGSLSSLVVSQWSDNGPVFSRNRRPRTFKRFGWSSCPVMPTNHFRTKRSVIDHDDLTKR